MKNFVILSSIDWEDNWQLHQELSIYLRSLGCNILFVENIGSRRVIIKKDFKRILRRIKNFFLSNFGFSIKNFNITILSPLFLPFPENYIISKINSKIISWQIKSWLKSNNLDNFIFLNFLPIPTADFIIKKTKPELSIFYFADSISSKSNLTNYLKSWEKYFANSSDIVFTTSNELFRQIKDKNKNTFIISPGVNLEEFEKNKKTSKKNNRKNNQKVIGYIGAISDVVDQSLLIKIAKKFNNQKLILVGPIYENIKKELLKIKNVKFIDKVSFPKLYSYYNEIDIGIIPYKNNKYTKSVVPTKLNEYLASDSEVVTTNLPEILKIFKKNKLFYIAKNHSEFLNKIRFILKNKKKTNLKLRKNYLSKVTWHTKFNYFWSKVNEIHLEKKLKQSFDTVKIIKLKVFSITNKILKTSMFIFVLYLVLFFTPFIDWISKPLMVKSIVQNSDAIIVFSGAGNQDYMSNEYLYKVERAVKLYNKNRVKKIILTSGQSNVYKDVQVMEAMLKYQGIDDSSIYVFYEYPVNTFNNVQMVKKYMKDNNIKKIICITSPLHEKRLFLTLLKQGFKKHEISFDNQVFKFLKFKNFNSKIDYMKNMIYEYLAIVHNYFNDRI
jgi:uncharacterized SAM-binding protein YcdF (DUF218 family)